ncbi:MAG: AAA family ATPase [Candidatus Omnitrophica bacterium]|nr:AAA family ATPase [Candidatus Omnitrophota bacterium]
MEKCKKEIDILVRARYPLIFVTTYEEERLAGFISNLSKEQNKQLFLWSVTSGMHKHGENKIDEATKDPLSALNCVERQTGPVIFLFHDFHPYLSDPAIVRKLRDLVKNLKSTYETLIFVSPVLSVPVELEKDLAIVDMELPDREIISGLLDSIASAVSSRSAIKIDLPREIKEKLVDAALGLTYNEAENAFARAIVTDNALGIKDIERVLDEKKQIIRKSGILDYFHTEEKIGNVGGLNNLKAWLKKRALAFTQKAKDFGLPEPKGILLVGVQGCGKSLTAKAVSNLWQIPLLRFDVGRVFSGIVGSSEENMRKAIKTAESIAPVILWIDEIEKSLSGVQSSTFSDAGTSARVFGTFITWLQEKNKPVFVIATANNIQLLPPELLRKGRFDEIFFIDLPSTEERAEIFKIHLRKRNRKPENFDVGAMAGASFNFSGAEIEQAVISALFDAFTENRELTSGDIINSIKNSVPLALTMSETINGLRQWAETRTVPATINAMQDGKPAGGRKLEL